MAYGAGVTKPETLVKSVERKLRRRVSPQIEDWNCSSPGWNTEDQVDFLEQRGFSFHPDMVLICFNLNDATDWKDGYLDAQQDQENDPDPECRRRHERHKDCPDGLIDQAVLLERGYECQRHRHCHGEDCSVPSEKEG